MSLLRPQKPTWELTSINFAFGPTTDSCSATNFLYSINSVAAASSVRGIVRPSTFAVLRLRIRSNLVGC